MRAVLLLLLMISGVWTELDELPHDVGVTLLGGQDKCGIAFAVDDIGVWTELDELPHDAGMTFLGCREKAGLLLVGNHG